MGLTKFWPGPESLSAKFCNPEREAAKFELAMGETLEAAEWTSHWVACDNICRPCERLKRACEPRAFLLLSPEKRHSKGVGVKPDELDGLLRSAYGHIRRRGSVVMRGEAFFRWKRTLGPGQVTTFYAASDGSVWRNDRAALLAELRIIMLRRGLPVDFVALFDRTV